MALLSGAALLVRTARNLASVRPGYDTENILAMTVTTVQRDKWKEFHTQALERVAALPGVTRAAFAWGLPLTGNNGPATWRSSARRLGPARRASDLPMRAVTPDYFELMGIPLVEGRGFRLTDDVKAPPVAIVNHAGAAPFGRTNPMGRTIRPLATRRPDRDRGRRRRHEDRSPEGRRRSPKSTFRSGSAARFPNIWS